MSMQREAHLIKDCLTFSGPPDPLRGEEIYRRYISDRPGQRRKDTCVPPPMWQTAVPDFLSNELGKSAALELLLPTPY